MALALCSSPGRHGVARGVAAFLGFAFLVVACSSQSDETVGATSSAVVVVTSCTFEGSCPSEMRQLACLGVAGCSWTVGTGSCASTGWCADYDQASCHQGIDGGPTGCEWLDGSCKQSQPCPTGDDVTATVCESANQQCWWTQVTAGRCSQPIACPSKATSAAQCQDGHPGCHFTATVGGCTNYCGKYCC